MVAWVRSNLDSYDQISGAVLGKSCILPRVKEFPNIRGRPDYRIANDGETCLSRFRPWHTFFCFT
jgi:hypothetical protein